MHMCAHMHLCFCTWVYMCVKIQGQPRVSIFGIHHLGEWPQIKWKVICMNKRIGKQQFYRSRIVDVESSASEHCLEKEKLNTQTTTL